MEVFAIFIKFNSTELKNRQSDILKFTLSPLAKAGMIVKNMAGTADVSEHDHSRPHRDDHYLFMFAVGGDLIINVDFETKKIAAPMMLLIFPGQIHHTVSSSHLQGWGISIDPTLIDKEFQMIFERGFQGPLSISIASSFYGHAFTLLEAMEKLQGISENPFQLRASHSILDALMGLLAGETIRANNYGKTKANRAAVIEQAFMQLVKLHYKEWKQPARYAAELNISVAHLYDTIKSITGDSVSAYIQQYCMLEAKRMLCFTKSTVKEISYELGYDDSVYFGKLFKKVTGFSPLQFRQQYLDQDY